MTRSHRHPSSTDVSSSSSTIPTRIRARSARCSTDAGLAITTRRARCRASRSRRWTPSTCLLVMGGPMDVWQEDEHPWLVARRRRAIRHWVAELGAALPRGVPGPPAAGRRPRRDVGPMAEPEIGVVRDPPAPQRAWTTRCSADLPERTARPAVARGRGGHNLRPARPSWPGTSTAPSRRCASAPGRWGVQFHVEVEASDRSEMGRRSPNTSDALAAHGCSAASLEQAVRTNLETMTTATRTLFQGIVGSTVGVDRSPMTPDAESARAQLAPDVVHEAVRDRTRGSLASRVRARLVHLGLVDASGVLREQAAGARGRAACLRGGLELHRRHPVVGARRRRLASGRRAAATRRGRSRFGSPVSVRRRRGLLPGRVRAAAARTLAPRSSCTGWSSVAAAAGLGARGWLGVRMHRARSSRLPFRDLGVRPTPVMTANRCWSALTMAIEDEHLGGLVDTLTPVPCRSTTSAPSWDPGCLRDRHGARGRRALGRLRRSGQALHQGVLRPERPARPPSWPSWGPGSPGSAATPACRCTPPSTARRSSATSRACSPRRGGGGRRGRRAAARAHGHGRPVPQLATVASGRGTGRRRPRPGGWATTAARSGPLLTTRSRPASSCGSQVPTRARTIASPCSSGLRSGGIEERLEPPPPVVAPADGVMPPVGPPFPAISSRRRSASASARPAISSDRPSSSTTPPLVGPRPPPVIASSRPRSGSATSTMSEGRGCQAGDTSFAADRRSGG